MTHHLLMRLCGGSQYWIIGDDVWVAGREVAVRYAALVKSLGVDISQPKTFFPSSDKTFWSDVDQEMELLKGENLHQ